MRLKNKEIEIIKKVVAEHIASAKIYLFGSRVDSDKRGGDIDIYIVSDNSNYASKIKIKAKLKRLLGKPVDILMHKDFNRIIEQEALKGIEL